MSTKTFEGDDYKAFTDARIKFRLKRVDGVRDIVSVSELAQKLGITETESEDILAGNIPVEDDKESKTISYDTEEVAAPKIAEEKEDEHDE
jgi:hypothetical protein